MKTLLVLDDRGVSIMSFPGACHGVFNKTKHKHTLAKGTDKTNILYEMHVLVKSH